MTDTSRSGFALILGAAGALLTMAVHPTTSAGVVTLQQIDHLAVVSGAAHSLAMVSFLVLFLGTMGLTRRLAGLDAADRPDYLAHAGLVVYGFAALALLVATTVSGFIMPTLLRHMTHDGPSYLETWKIALDAVFQFNQAFAKVYSVAASGAILLWSASALRHGGLARGIAIYGCILAPVLTVLIAVGHLQLNVHGMAAVVLVQAVWFVWAGLQLRGAKA